MSAVLKQRLLEAVAAAVAVGASDLHVSSFNPPMMRLDGTLSPVKDAAVWTPDELNALIEEFLPPQRLEDFRHRRSADHAFSTEPGCRFRLNAYHERGWPALAIRRLENRPHTFDELGLPKQLAELATLRDGLVLFTGPTGSGKSTSLAALIDAINKQRACHILTIEDPIEYTHANQRSLVHQRELGSDVGSFADALRDALREDPDVILVGEMRDLPTIRAALTAAETGHLVFSTLHCSDTVGAIDRITAMYPAEEQASVLRQISHCLKGVVAQRLLPKAKGGRAASVEILRFTPAVANLVRTGQLAQIYTVLETGAQQGQLPFDQNLAELVAAGTVNEADARPLATSRLFEERLVHLRRSPKFKV